MSQSRFDAIFSGQSAIARKVYGAVPMADSWNITKVVAELVRQGFAHDQRTVAGCLDGLQRAGLINEVNRGEFRRESIKGVSADRAVIRTALVDARLSAGLPLPSGSCTASSQMDKEAISSPMDILGDLATRAAGIAQAVKDLCTDIGNAAIDIQQRVEDAEADTSKFKQLQTLLKSMS